MIKLKKSRFILILVCVIAAAALVTAGGMYVYMQAQGVVMVPEKDYRELSDMGDRYAKLYRLQTTLEEKSLYDFDREKAMDAVYRAATDAVGDKYTAYLDEEERKAWTNYTEGTFSGVGISFAEEESGELVITSVAKEGLRTRPAYKKATFSSRLMASRQTVPKKQKKPCAARKDLP